MRILFTQVTADRYGSDRALLMLVTRLIRRGWHATVIVPYHGPLVDDLEAVGATVVVSPVGAPRRVYTPRQWAAYFLFDLPMSIVRTRRLARHFDVVHVNTALTIGPAIGAWLAGRPLVWHLRESFKDQPRSWRFYGRMMRLARTIVATSNELADELRNVGLGDRTVVIPEGLDDDRLATPGSTADPRRVVTVGRINSIKGHDVLVEAVGILDARGVKVPVTIAGDSFPGQEAIRGRLVARIAELGLQSQVELPGYVTDVAGLFARSSIFVFPSVRPEGFGLALIEAMAAGLACIATDHGGPREIIRDGETGLLIPPGDAEALAKAIEQLWTDAALRARLGQAAAADVRRRYSADATAEQVEAIYQDLVGTADAPPIHHTVGVVVPLYNGRELITDCLRSIPAGVEVVVVDDGSTDGAPELVATDFPAVQLLRNERNIGFGGTANRGLAACTAEVRIVLNSDARLTPNALAWISAAFDDPQVGVAGPRLVFADGSHQTSAASFPTPGSIVTGAYLLNRLYRTVVRRGRFPFELGLTEADHQHDRDVDWVLGASITVRDACLADLDGGFDEGYFMYAEETDLCWRARQAGWRVRLAANAEVVHLGGGSTGDPVVQAERSMKSEGRFMARAYGSQRLWRWRAARALGALVKIPLMAGPALIDRRVRTRLRWQLTALRVVLSRRTA